MPFEAALQAQLGVAHPVDLVHIGLFHQLLARINYSSSTPAPPSSECAAHRYLQDDLYCISVERRRGFSSAKRRGWTIPQCDLILMTASSPHYHEVTQISTDSQAKRNNRYLSRCCVGHESMLIVWLTTQHAFHFGLKLSISSQISHCFTYL